MNRLPEKLLDKIVFEPASGCWLWGGSVSELGYGLVYYDKDDHYAHRLIYEILMGPIPPSLCCDHLCRVRSCVNPDHIELVTIRDNVLRGSGITARQARQTHCKRGHEYTESNMHVDSRGRRSCRACKAANARRRYWASESQQRRPR